MSNLALCLLNVVCMSVGQLLFKYGMKGKVISSGSDMIFALLNPIIIIAVIVYACTTVLWLYILNRIEISYAYPIQSLAMPIVCILGIICFNENLTAAKLAGIIIITFGVIVISK